MTSTWLRALGAVTASIGVAACDPAAGLTSRLNVSPVPARGCVDAALATSFLLANARFADSSIRRGRQHRMYQLTYSDSVMRRFPGALWTEVKSDSVEEIAVSVKVGARLNQAPASTRVTLAALNDTLLRELRARCARGSVADTVVCTQGGMFDRTRPCVTGL